MTVPTFEDCCRIWAAVNVLVGRTASSCTTRSPTLIAYGMRNCVCGVTIPRRQRGAHRHHLEGRAGLVGVLDRHVVGVARRTAWAIRSWTLVVVVAGRGRHRQDRAVARIQHQRGGRVRARAAHGRVQHRLHLLLDGAVDRELDVAALLGASQRDRAERDAAGAAHLELLAGVATQHVVVLVLDAGAERAAVVVVDVADQLRGQLAGRVVAAHGVDREQPGRVRRHDLGGDGGVELRQHPRLHHVRHRQPGLPAACTSALNAFLCLSW